MYKHKALIAGITLSVGLAVITGVAFWESQRGRLEKCSRSGFVGGDLGGDINLISETGKYLTNAEIFAQPTFLYFGYTFCPDVCPIDAARNAEAVTRLNEMGLKTIPIFVTIDPERDSIEVLKEFTDYMHPEMIGLTGNIEDIRKATKAYGVYYKKQPSDDPEFYLMDHTSFTYFVLPKHGFVDFFRRETSAEKMAARAACYLRAAG